MSTAGAVRRRSARDAALSPDTGQSLPAAALPRRRARAAHRPGAADVINRVSYNLRYEKTMLRTNAHF